MTTEIVPVAPVQGTPTETLPSEDPQAPRVGRWYWVKRKWTDREGVENEYRWFGCVDEMGSNYIHLSGPLGKPFRIHSDKFWDFCEFVEDPDAVIQENVNKGQYETRELMAKVKEITARLALTGGPGLGSGEEASALTVYSGQSMDAYKSALVLAKETTLPELFKEIKKTNELLGQWMAAPMIPLEAQVGSINDFIEPIKKRIFSVQLYAGLCEDVVQVADGEPAGLTEKIHLFQRRAYMDEECLAAYETGGMNFKNIQDFDRWLVKPKNLARLLPFPRCILAFRVRRHRKDYGHAESVSDLIQFEKFAEWDKCTFLYIRNGEQVFRLETQIEFGEKLFPDMEHHLLSTGMLYAKCDRGRVEKVITENQWLGMKEDEKRKRAEVKKAQAANAKLPKDKQRYVNDYVDHFHNSSHYSPFDQSNVFYDDIAKHIHDKMEEHNRLVLVLQGLLDRSPVLHPHPTWQLWDPGSFGQALELIYDESRTLVAGPPPDFKAYRDGLNAKLEHNSITIGQEDAWERIEAIKMNEREDNRGRSRGGSSYRTTHHRPYGNPGPGKFARVAKVTRTGKVTFEWTRERQRARDDYSNDPLPEVGCTLSLSVGRVFNVSAYKPGDFHQFFDDPRTRQDYLQWAGMLLEAEEYHAGNRKVADLKPLPPPRKRTGAGSYEYQKRKRLNAFVGRAVRLTRDITMKNGKVYKESTLWRVTHIERSKLSVTGIKRDGTDEEYKDWSDRRAINGLYEHDVIFDPRVVIPVKPEKKEPPKKKVTLADDECDEADRRFRGIGSEDDEETTTGVIKGEDDDDELEDDDDEDQESADDDGIVEDS